MAAEDGAAGFFGQPLEELLVRNQRALPLVQELEAVLLRGDRSLASPAALSATLDLAAHPSLYQLLDAACALLDSQGPHCSLAPALAMLANWKSPTHSAGADAEGALAIGVLLRWLRLLPTPAIPAALYAPLLEASTSTAPALLRKSMPTANLALIQAMGGLFGRLLVHNGVVRISPVAAQGDAADERALQALVFALTPALLRPSDDASGLPPADRASAQRAVRTLLRYYAQRELAQLPRAGAGDARGSAPTPTMEGDADAEEAVTNSPRASSPLASPAASPVAVPSSSSSPVLVTAAAAIMRMFEREFGSTVGADSRDG